MSSEGSVTRLLPALEVGDPTAVQAVWQRYFDRLVGLARKRLADPPRRTIRHLRRICATEGS